MDFGPRKAGTPDDPFRDFGGFLGTPEGDRNKYYIMRHAEFDYDQLFCALDHTADGWLPRDEQAYNFADGFDTRYLLSCGPFDIDPGEVLPMSFAYIGGENFHTDCNAFENLFDANDPYPFYNQLNFEDLGINSMWASWIYDNPGVDTDGDGYYGKYRICVYDSTFAFDTASFNPLVVDTIVVYLEADTIYYEGDRVPDFRGAAPPRRPRCGFSMSTATRSEAGFIRGSTSSTRENFVYAGTVFIPRPKKMFSAILSISRIPSLYVTFADGK